MEVLVRPARPADAPPLTGEVQALYVRPGTWGRGGRRTVEEAETGP